MTRIDPCKRFKTALPRIQKPARYLGGENGSIVKDTADIRIALCFPDLYEIAMANNAMRILYAGLNSISGVACERVFSVGLDYEALLRSSATPLYGLETGTPISDFDILAFTMGYELAASNLLTVLDLSGIPIRSSERGEDSPVIIAGGPAISNPVPYSNILDAVWIGEAENAFFDLVTDLASLKRAGCDKAGILERIMKEAAIWTPTKKAVRHVFSGFSNDHYEYVFPTPIVKPIQDHGVVEIMRGCPNGCRFCHAGYFYRPRRLRSVERILEDVETQIRVAGHREISLSSLSSGDYPGIASLVSLLNKKWSYEGVSFQLPSLKVESFPIEIIEDISGTRKSGLTFAIETPLETWQLALNKKASLEKIRLILKEAQSRGYRVAKFYFMLGLPLPDLGIDEDEAIIALIRDIAASTPELKLNITLATFVPKPHTPFQWHSQLPVDDAASRIYAIKSAFRGNQRVKISYHAPYLSWLEGVVARGDERVGELIISAFEHGARFDAWDDLFRKDAWESAIAAAFPELATLVSERQVDDDLPWSSVSLRVSKKYLLKERELSMTARLTPVCTDDCLSPCGACSDTALIEDDSEIIEILNALLQEEATAHSDVATQPANTRYIPADGTRYRLMFKYKKLGRAAFFAHHEIQSMISSSMERAGLYLAFSQGFNPMPRLEISEPLSLGFESSDEYGVALLIENPLGPIDAIIPSINKFLHGELQIQEARILACPDGARFPSLSSVHWGSRFTIDLIETGLEASSFLAFFGELKDKEPRLADASCEAHDRCIDLLLPFTGTRELGLSALFESAFGVPIRESRVSVMRVIQFAKNRAVGMSTYFDRYTDY
ncbi:MAG: DUF2344 domain-containing protein [Spirochaetia bacterium]|jgi:radical SAM superfamily enzyme YgiQ (UPF0313 family)|nr:DUF2344 domain-containing protein [Spirochaetia bacterium]